MSSNTLKLQNINKHYGKHKHALCDFSYEFTNGIYGLLGPNGLRYKLKKLSSTSLR